MPKTKAKNLRKKTAKSSRRELVRAISFMDGRAITQLLNAVQISGASAEELVRLKKEVKRISIAEPTDQERAMLQQQQQAAQAAQQQPSQ